MANPTIHTINTRTILTDAEYSYVVSVSSDDLHLEYVEQGRKSGPIHLGFGSAEEMRAGAFAMLDLTGGR